MKIHVLLCSQFIIETTSPLFCKLCQILKAKKWYLIDILNRISWCLLWYDFPICLLTFGTSFL